MGSSRRTIHPVSGGQKQAKCAWKGRLYWAGKRGKGGGPVEFAGRIHTRTGEFLLTRMVRKTVALKTRHFLLSLAYVKSDLQPFVLTGLTLLRGHPGQPKRRRAKLYFQQAPVFG